MKLETIIIIIAGVVIIYAILGIYYNVLNSVMEERRYILMEMESADEEEYEFWKKELRKLYLSCIPIIGRIWR